MSPAPDDLAERLAANADAFRDAPADTGSMFELPPDGDYTGQLDRFDFFEGGSPAQALLAFRWQIVDDPDYGGRVADVVYNLEDTERFRFLKADLAKLGAAPDSYELTDLIPGSPFLDGLLDIFATLRVKTSSKTDQNGVPYRNVYVQERVEGAGFEGRPSDIPLPGAEDFAVPAPQGATDDDIPF